MLLDLEKLDDVTRAGVYLEKLTRLKAKIEIRKIDKPRTINQNSYLHALFAIFGNEFGYTIDESKILIKRELGWTYKKSGQVFLKHTSDMTVDELSRFIDRFRTFSAHLGCYLPTADEFKDNHFEIMKQVRYAETH